MRTKMGTTIDEGLLEALKELSSREDRRLNEIIEEALRRYLVLRELDGHASIVEASAGKYDVNDEQLAYVLEEDPDAYE